MELERVQIIAIIVNAIVILFSALATGLLIWKLHFKDRNTRLLFILYIFYWMTPLLCREYTGQMHLHMYEIHDNGSLLWVPLIVYGLIGIFWRPLNDLFAFKLKSRRNVIFISLGLQLVTIIPFLVTQNFATNIIQSVGSGIGASAIGLFNLMFDEEYHEHKIFKTVSIITLPPLIAEVISSGIESLCCSFLQEGEIHRYESYRGVMIYVWVAAVACIVISFILAAFIKEKKHNLYKENVHKEPVKTKADKWVVALMCICGACVLLVKWCTCGPTATSQLIYVGESYIDPSTGLVHAVDTRFYEGYYTMVYAFGQLLGTTLAGLWLVKSKSKNHVEKPIIFAIACATWIIYLFITAKFLSVPVYFALNALNGIAMGLIWPVMLGIMINKFFVKSNRISPFGVFNTSLSIGISLGTVLSCAFKGNVLDFESRIQIWGRRAHWNQFVTANGTVNMICAGLILLTLILFVVSYVLHTKYPPKKVKIRRMNNIMGEAEI